LKSNRQRHSPDLGPQRNAAHHQGVAQRVGRHIWDVEVAGAEPATLTKGAAGRPRQACRSRIVSFVPLFPVPDSEALACKARRVGAVPAGNSTWSIGRGGRRRFAKPWPCRNARAGAIPACSSSIGCADASASTGLEPQGRGPPASGAIPPRSSNPSWSACRRCGTSPGR
jgi:hypothetical protein